MAKDVGILPPNYCTPVRLVDEPVALSQRHGSVSREVLESDELLEQGMNALLSVSAGSDEAACLILLRHHNALAEANRPEVLLGKGVRSIVAVSLKTARFIGKHENRHMWCRRAMQVCAALELPINVTAVIAAACFLSRFAQEVRWTHLDVADTATNSPGKSATGRPVPLIVQFLLDRFQRECATDSP